MKIFTVERSATAHRHRTVASTSPAPLRLVPAPVHLLRCVVATVRGSPSLCRRVSLLLCVSSSCRRVFVRRGSPTLLPPPRQSLLRRDWSPSSLPAFRLHIIRVYFVAVLYCCSSSLPPPRASSVSASGPLHLVPPLTLV
ncbi:uncharacterized protein DS421_11g330240 [Arachis hypogaea]|uniref:Uncharacterized protein n=1 Tax=Arachis hypogaea TaxID=3818 RepID=A0A445ARJ5_ARAHY|nr:uncharacterized protein DS421_11g330240 [Arachis hypogaea]RYR29042.1 hypothetical protein Ahy_B01g053320 isoform D [Arachis hypogaea]